ncbi:hypothetical protein G5V59_24240 [Nocardioides sp. W3-2-3]|uniref:N-acetylmuramoyl-L-alanine amidase n=1 Tax=Nocardioides convexus TaxID=2712224 RepID=UPI002418A00F|nr:N-acetylmuramoyl-L-alanine amidase [Nocardioides convexus]NHA01756.1 hypothetical protein [Nocardioides convexus]
MHAGFVHHTVNANNYTAAQVPGIIRGIYNYHVKTRGWSDIGYNFLVDKFGRIWEGRYGGVDRPVVGAHTQGYNQYSFAMSAIGNYDVAAPSSAMITAYAQALRVEGSRSTASMPRAPCSAWAAATSRPSTATATRGRPPVRASTSTPRYRTSASEPRRCRPAWVGRNLESNFVGVVQPDIVARRTSDGRGIVLPIRQSGTRYVFSNPIDTGQSLQGPEEDLEGGRLGPRRQGRRPRHPFERQHAGALPRSRWRQGSPRRGTWWPVRAKLALLAPVGDVTGDGWPDMMGQPPGGTMRIYPGWSLAGFKTSLPGVLRGGHRHPHRRRPLGRRRRRAGQHDPPRRQSLTVYYGNGPGGWTSSKAVPQSVAGFDWLLGVSSVDSDGHTDFLGRNATTDNVYWMRGTSAGLQEGQADRPPGRLRPGRLVRSRLVLVAQAGKRAVARSAA